MNGLKFNFGFFVFLLLFFASTNAYSEISFDIPTNEKDGDALIERLKNSTLPQVQMIERCIRETNGIVSSYSSVKGLYLGRAPLSKTLAIDIEKTGYDGAIDLNIYRNFQAFGETNRDFFKYLNEFVENEIKLSLSTDLSASNDEITAYRGRIERLKVNLQPLMRQETYLLSLFDRSKSSLVSLIQSNSPTIDWLLGDSCANASISWKIAYLNNDAQDVLGGVKDLRDYVLALRTRRTNILMSLEIAGTKRLENHWRQLFVEKGNQTLEEIDLTIQGIKLGAEIREYWYLTNARGLGDNLHLRYLQYKAPLRIMLSQQGRLNRFDKRIAEIEKLPADMKAEYSTLLQTYHATLNRNIDDLIKKGWKGQLDRQVLLNTKRQVAANGLCAQSINEHLSIAATIKNDQDFAKAEQAYAKSVDVCGGK